MTASTARLAERWERPDLKSPRPRIVVEPHRFDPGCRPWPAHYPRGAEIVRQGLFVSKACSCKNCPEMRATASSTWSYSSR